MSEWYQLDVSEALRRLGVEAARGLGAAEAERRLRERGPNEIAAAARVSPWMILAGQLKNVLVLVLILAVGMSVALGHTVEAVVIGAILLLSVLLGFIQEYRAERAIEALREMAAPTATVVRDGETREVPARELVPGDVLLISAGDRVPADARVLEAANLQTDEAALTGESLPVDKTPGELAVGLGIGDCLNFVFAGTSVTYGRGRAVVVATGMETELGKVARMVESVESGPTPLQRNLDKVGRILALAGLAVVVLVVVLGLIRGQPFFDILLFGIALAVAVVPEALPAVVTISLALGVRRMVRRNALVRRLPAVETLGSVSVICSDKTGTLTKDEMTVRRLHVDGRTYEVTGAGYEPKGEVLLDGRPVEPSEGLRRLLTAAVLASDARLVRNGETEEWTVHGDPTEGALLVAAAKAGIHKAELDERHPRVDEIPFTSETKRMTTLHETEDGTVAFAKGAPEVLLPTCSRRWIEAGEVPLDDAGREEILRVAHEMAGEALRLLAVAGRSEATRERAEENLVFLGLVGMIDPPRQDVSPAHKLRVVTALQQRGHSVAMTGDGVNDAPALKKADIGIAMGLTGTDVSKEAAAMTLTDDNFASIVAAVEEGREVFENIKKYLMFLLSSNIGEIGLMAAASLAGLPMPLSAVQILYVNLATDGLPALALSVDPPEPDLMRRPPRDPRSGIFTRPVVSLTILPVIELGKWVVRREGFSAGRHPTPR